SASLGETFGITLLEAVGSGLPIIGFDRRYGMQMFVDEGENGFKILYASAQGLADGIIRLFTQSDLEAFRMHSYEKARFYLKEEVEKKWMEILS
ncbi:MAG: glycosyltransferase, partial [Lachnospiraceae bacterium]|nr:glycosyltransferase [Lachnospiraceae bacterium]